MIKQVFKCFPAQNISLYLYQHACELANNIPLHTLEFLDKVKFSWCQVLLSLHYTA